METLDDLNARLIDHYGIDTSTGRPIFRIVWANDQTEMRRVTELDSGIQLLHPVVREVKKYPYLKDLYVLERLVVVPEINREELPTSKLSYEPIWAYRDAAGQPLPPIWTPTKFIVDTLYAALGKKSLRKYVDSEENTTPEGMDARITKMCEELFGDETETGDALAYGEAIVVPRNYEKEN
jgi:hypothetical protein